MIELKLSVYGMNGWFLNTFMKTAYEWIVHTLYIVHCALYLHSTQVCTHVHVMHGRDKWEHERCGLSRQWAN